MHGYTKEKFSLPCVLTNSTNAWLWLAPTLTLVFTTFPNGLQSSISSSSLHSHGKFRTCNTFDGGCVYRNCGCPAVEVISPRETTRRQQETQQTNAKKHRQNTGGPQETHYQQTQNHKKKKKTPRNYQKKTLVSKRQQPQKSCLQRP
jgi:hypothetical protein